MKYQKRYAALFATSSIFLSSCGLLGSLQNRDVQGSGTSQVLLVASLGRGEKDGTIESYLIDPGTLSATNTGSMATPSPTFLALDKSGKILYATNETDSDAAVSAFGYNRSNGLLTHINSSLILGEAPTYVSIFGNKVVAANYGSGSITMMYREPSGALGQADWRIELGSKGSSHPHAAVFTPDGKDLFVTDLGLDKVFHFNISDGIPPITIDDGGADLPKGTGPRHLLLSKNGDFIYLIAELSPNIFVFKRDRGDLTLVQKVSTASKSSGAHIALSRDGRYLYTSFRSGGDGIMVHSIGTDGTLKQVGFTPTGKHPRQFALSPDGRFVAVAARDDNSVTFFERDPNFGTLTPTGTSISVPRPVFILWEEAK